MPLLGLMFCFDRRKMTYLMKNSHTSCFIETVDMHNLQKYIMYSRALQSTGNMAHRPGRVGTSLVVGGECRSASAAFLIH